MKREPYRAGPAVKPTGKEKRERAVVRMVIIPAILLITLTLLVSVAIAQNSDAPPVPDPVDGRPDMPLLEVQETADNVPEILRRYTVVVEANCSLNPLTTALGGMLAAGELREAPVLKGNQLHIVVGEAYLDLLSTLPCVQEIVPDGRDSDQHAQPDAPLLDAKPQPLKAGPEAAVGIDALGTISGAVTEEDSGLLLPDITVEVYNYPGPEAGWSLVDSADTGVDGTYSITDLPADTYRIGFFDWLAGTFVGEFFDDVFNLKIAFDIPVADGAAVQNIDAALSKPGQIIGTVQAAATGDLLEGIDVHAYKQNVIGWEKINSGTTLVNGTYVIDGLPSGLYNVHFEDTSGTYLTQFFDGENFRQDGDDVVVSGGATTSAVDASLTYPGHITGTVTAEAGGAPLIDIEACALVSKDSHWESLSCDITNSLGHYDVGDLPPGTYHVSFTDHKGDYNGEYYDDAQDLSSAADVSVTAGGTTQNISAALSSAGHITGTVTADVGGSPLVDIRVCALSFLNFDWRSVICDYTNAAGEYDLNLLPTATYRVEFYDHTGRYVVEYYTNAPDVFYARDVSVTADSTTENINAAMAEYGQISGTVTAEAGGAGLGSIKVCANYLGLYSKHRSRCTFTPAGGSYEIDNLHPGAYQVNFFDYTYTYVEEFYDDVAPGNSPNLVSVTGGQKTAGIDAALARYGFISGTVTAEDGGAPLAGIHVYAYIDTGAEWIYAGRGDTNANGEYEIGPLASGNYLVEYYDSSAVYMTEYFEDVLDPDLAGQVSVAAGSINQGVDAALALAITQDIALTAGWNMISSYVQPGNPALETLLEDIENDIIVLKNGYGQVYWPAHGINQIGDWNVHHGYQVYMDGPAMLSISGAAILPEQSPLNLPAGWSMVAYLRSSAMPTDVALASTDGQLYLAKNNEGKVYWPELGLNYIGDMLPGQGYKLYMTEPGILTYPGN